MSEVTEQIVSQPHELAACCEYLAQCPQFGFDTEFVGEDTYHPHLCLVQVATPATLFLIDALSVGPLDSFWQLVVDPRHQVIVHAGREEVRLCRLGAGKTPGNLFDIQIAAGLIGLAYPLGHAALVSQVLGVQLAKGETRSEWRDRPLTRQQIRYAFDDVRFLLPLWQHLADQLNALGRAAWAYEEFARLAVNAVPEETAQERWRKLRGLGALDRRRLAIVRGLFQWREEVATQKNRPARTIVRDDLVVEIARRNPSKEHDLEALRGLSRRDLAAIVQIAEQARALPPDQWPIATERDQDPPQLGLVANVVGAVLGDFCARKRLAPNLVASGQDVKLLVRAFHAGSPLSEESSLSGGWRRDHVLPELQAVLEGRRALRVKNIQADAPFAFE